ncbi:branched-chain amino acid ABC transporter permease [Pelolinea submarina]|uniref:Amino acid/amide ABC transporter membrane protein 1 (HAAT family) n=1 Tax=Pelolinea submarina TaxID=913107 RepID=A0A347ZQ16_9CHLR|nr:branched-chain amino acid ABC transporter permease [Pelolinea submarina]REG06274.1 amino acid/amide ABC transporter membrane protein 1 (HAAT family) [Pelolinea submarina]BBB47397.1 branched-chain amino acid transport system permease protein [Pelolinea submarina]
MERKNQNPIVNWIVKSKILGILFFVIIGATAVFKLGTALLDNPSLFLQQVVNGLQLGFVYALIALGYTMIYGIIQLINFAHGDVFMVGAFASFYSISRYNVHLWFQNLFPSVPAMLAQAIGAVTVVLVSMVVCALLAFTIERIAYKPLRTAPRISALITAIGISFFLEYFGALGFVFTPNYITYERPFEVTSWYIGPEGFGSIQAGVATPPHSLIFSNIFLIIVLASVFLLLVLQYIVKRTKIGKAMRAVAYDKPTARLMGINSDAVISITFALGAALAGAAGVLYAIAYPQVFFSMGIIPGMKAFVAAVVGGIGSIPGAFIGALIMGQAETLSAAYISTPMRDAIAFSLLIVVLLIRPKGIMGETSSEKV